MPDTKAISNAMATFLFILIQFGLQNNGNLLELLPYLCGKF